MNPRNAGVSPANSVVADKTPAPRGQWLGLVLAGGRSTRFGGEKAVAMLGDRPLMIWCADALGGACPFIAISARRGSEAEARAQSLGLEVIYDDPTHPAGPLAGIAAGLFWAQAHGFDGLVTLPCDTPLVGAGELKRLIAASANHPAAYAAPPGRAQGLCAAWRVSLAGSLHTRLAGGDHPAVHRWLDEIGARSVAFADAARFRNINTREELGAFDAKA